MSGHFYFQAKWTTRCNVWGSDYWEDFYLPLSFRNIPERAFVLQLSTLWCLHVMRNHLFSKPQSSLLLLTNWFPLKSSEETSPATFWFYSDKTDLGFLTSTNIRIHCVWTPEKLPKRPWVQAKREGNIGGMKTMGIWTTWCNLLVLPGPAWAQVMYVPLLFDDGVLLCMFS